MLYITMPHLKFIPLEQIG